MSRYDRWATPLAIAGLLVAFALRAHLLGDQDLWWDEGLAVWAARQPLAQATLWTASDVHPPLYFWSLWSWIRLAGDSPFAMRFLTLAFGMLSVAVGGAVGRKLGGPWVATLAVWLLALARFEVWWSQEMRMYMLAGTLGLLAAYAMLRMIDPSTTITAAGSSPGSASPRSRPRRSRTQVVLDASLYILAATGALYTIYLSSLNLLILSLLVAAVAAVRWATGQRRSSTVLLAQWLVANLIVVALVIPWLGLATSQMKSWSVAEPTPLGFPFLLYGALLSTGVSTEIGAVGWAIVLVGLVVALGVAVIAATAPTRETARPIRFSGASTWLISLWLLLVVFLPPLAIHFLTQPGRIFYVPRLEARYFLPFAATFYVLLSWVIIRLWQRRRIAGLVSSLVVLGVFAWFLPQHYAGRHLIDGYPSIARTIRAHAQAGDAVVLVSGGRYPLFLYEYDRTGLDGVRPPAIQVPQHNPVLTPGNVTAELEPILRDYRRLWLVLADPHMEDPDGLALPWLQSRLETNFDQRFNDKRLLLLAAAPQPLAAPLNAAQPQHPIAASDSSPVRPTGYDLPVPRVVPGESAYQAVYWQNGAGRTITYTWRHESGRVVGVVTATLPAVQDGDARSIVELPAYSATPAGAYRLIAQLPDASTFDLPGPTVAGTRSLPTGPPRTPQPAQVGDFELIGFAVEPAGATVSRGQTVTLYLDWRIGRRADRRYTFFAHLLGDAFNPATNGPVWAGQDSEPLGGGLPTPQWWTGDVIRDELKLSVPADAPPGQYQIEIGAYPTGDPQRLAVEGEGADAANRRVLLNLPVKIE